LTARAIGFLKGCFRFALNQFKRLQWESPQISLSRGPRVRHTVFVRSANTDTAIKVSAVLAVLWGALIRFAFTKFRKRALCFLLGTPVIVFWFFVLFLIAWGSAHNIKACP
jgi:hypothetical protein